MKRQKTVVDMPATSQLLASSTSTELVISGPSLGPAQKLFNQLLASLEKNKDALQNLRQLADGHRRQTAERVYPLLQQQRLLKKQIILFFDRRLQDPQGLSKAVRAYVRQVVCNLALELVTAAQDDELIAVYKRHAGATKPAGQADAFADADAAMQAMMANVFGMDLGDDALAWPEQVIAAAMRKMQQQREQREQHAGAQAAWQAKQAKQAKVKKTSKQARAERDSIDADKVLRGIYRRLASALHPDRELDAKERQRKTLLMVEVNVAHEKKDLLALLQIQLKVEQIDPAALSSLADDKLRHFNRMLKEQAASLQVELAQEQQALRSAFNLSYGPITQKLLDTALRYEVREQQEFIDQLAQAIEQVQDDRGLKSWVKLQKSLRDDEDDEFDDLQWMSLLAARAGRR